MSHTFSLMPQSYRVHHHIHNSQWKYACVSCGAWASDPVGGGLVHNDCASFTQSPNARKYGPGGKDYPFSFQWIGAPVPPSSNQQQQAPMTASGLPIRVPDSPAWKKEAEAPAKVVTPPHRAGLDPEEIDWQAHKDFMRGM